MITLTRFICIVCLASGSISNASAQALDPILGAEKLWTLKQDQFQAATGNLPFRWTSNAKDSARAAAPGMTLFGLRVYEVVARFEGETLKEITAAFYARGDAGELDKEHYESLVGLSAAALNNFTATKYTVRGKDPSNAVKAEGLQWQTDKGRYLLEYSFTKEVKTRSIPFRAEFVRLEITPPEHKASLLTSATNITRAKFTGLMHVKRDNAGGDTWLFDVPMIDQGQKGYCVVAATERVMRYYGIAVDANELAQIANSDSQAGTSSEGMFSALKKIATRLHVRVRMVEEQSVKAIQDMVKDYNRAAKHAHATEIPPLSHLIDVGAIYKNLDYAVLKEARTKNSSDLSRFQRAVQTNIDQGTPLLWCVQLGLSPEPGIPQNAGGHMRLIIGYNSSSHEILFSDSWGAGHELKRMPAADAWTITTGLTTVEPL